MLLTNFRANVADLTRTALVELGDHLFPGARLVPVSDPTQSCVIAGRPHTAHHGLLCDNHLQALTRILSDIEDEALRLAVTPSLAVSYDGGGGGTLASQRSPIRLDARVLRDRRRGTGIIRGTDDLDESAWDPTPSVLETLHAWERLVRAERHLPMLTVTVILGRAPGRKTIGPTCPRLCGHDTCGPWITDSHSAPATVTGARKLLSRQLDWVARQPWVDDMFDELTDLLAAMKRVNSTIDVHVGICESLQPNGTLCDGKVWHVLVKPDGKIAGGDQAPGPHDEPGFRCGSCRRVWTGTDAVRKRNDMWLDEQTRKTEKGKNSS